VVDRAGVRPLPAAEVERERHRRALIADLTTATIHGGGSTSRGKPTACALLARLIEAGPTGVDAAALYASVWGGREYHPLEHRNTLYVAINRLRRTLAELLPGREVIENVTSGWRIAADIDACTIRPAQPGE
jgi:DNA-binding winged helix-turn-helix (wHTH) protein